MTDKPLLPALLPAVAIPILFGTILAYNGAGHSLHCLSLWGLLLMIWLSALITRQDLAHVQLSWGWLPMAVLAYLLWLLCSPFVSTYPYASTSAAWALAVMPLTMLGWFLSPSTDDGKAWRLTWHTLWVCGALLALWGLVDFVVLNTRSHGPLIDANAYAALMNLFLIPIAFSYLTAPVSRRGLANPRIHLALIALLACAQFMSLSRGAVMALLAILPLLLWFGRSGTEFRRRLPWLILVLVAAYALVKFGPFEQRRGVETFLLAPGAQMEEDPALSARLLMWKSTLRIIHDSNALIGTGLGTYKSYYVAYREEMETSGNLAHNDYLQGLQEGGLIQLGFFLVLTIFAPLWLIYRVCLHAPRQNPGDNGSNAIGLLLGVVCVSLHAIVNFVHFVPSIAFLAGLYLARAWETVHPREQYRLLPIGMTQIKPSFLKILFIAMFAVPTTVLMLDGVIFKLFSGRGSIFDRLDSPTRYTVRNVALTLRPSNPYPRASLIQELLKAAHHEQQPEVRKQLLERAEREAEFLATSAPGLASGRFLTGRIRMMKGTPEDLKFARDDLEYAVNRVPPATNMRLELIRVYQKLGQHEDAYQSVRAAKKWVTLEVNPSSLIAFAKEARTIALAHNDREEADFWSSVLYSVATKQDTGS